MSGSYVWLSNDIARIATGGVKLAPSWEFAAGVAWLAEQLNAPVRLPERPLQIVTVDVTGKDVEQCT